jgi:threonine dehydrogenase-like Zn-dependent dehydrogenase
MMWKPTKAFVAGAGPLGLLATIILRLRGLEVYTVATRTRESLKAQIVESVGGNYVNVLETPIRDIQEKFDVVLEATGRVDITLESLELMGENSVLCVLGIYREMRACQEFGKVLTNMVLGNRLMFGSVSSNKTHFERGIQDMKDVRKEFGRVLGRILTKRLELEEFKQAFEPERENIKTMICFN